ncbi:MAG: hypothetical protein IJK41_02575 [Muribaculaceae bacterium]|nr:hypothetical protein [Muribaculaceae bacterium]
MSKKTANATIWVCIIVMMAVALYLVWIKVLDNGWLFPIFLIGTTAITGVVMFIQSRIDPESHKAWKAELLKEAEADEKAEKEIKSMQIRRTIGGTICEFITLMMLIVSWIQIFHKQLFEDDIFKLGIALTIGAIWFLVTAYFHRVMGFKPTTVKQLHLGIYRKRALSIGCALFLLIGVLFLNVELGKVAEGLLIAYGLLFVLLFGSKFVINSFKK